MREVESHLVDLDYKRVAFDKLDNGLDISTVWLGLDHQYGSGPPIIFETMIFVPAYSEFWIGDRKRVNTREEFGEMARYSTEEEARIGHKKFVEKYSLYRSVEQIMEAPPVDKPSQNPTNPPNSA